MVKWNVLILIETLSEIYLSISVYFSILNFFCQLKKCILKALFEIVKTILETRQTINRVETTQNLCIRSVN